MFHPDEFKTRTVGPSLKQTVWNGVCQTNLVSTFATFFSKYKDLKWVVWGLNCVWLCEESNVCWTFLFFCFFFFTPSPWLQQSTKRIIWHLWAALFSEVIGIWTSPHNYTIGRSASSLLFTSFFCLYAPPISPRLLSCKTNWTKKLSLVKSKTVEKSVWKSIYIRQKCHFCPH